MKIHEKDFDTEHTEHTERGFGFLSVLGVLCVSSFEAST